MKSLEGIVFYPFPKPTKRMINGVAVSDSDSDAEEEKDKSKNEQLLAGAASHPPARKKIALVVDTNVLIKQTELRETLHISDQAQFDELFEVYTLDSVIGEIKDEHTRRYVDQSLPYPLVVKDVSTWLDRKDFIQV